MIYNYDTNPEIVPTRAMIHQAENLGQITSLVAIRLLKTLRDIRTLPETNR